MGEGDARAKSADAEMTNSEEHNSYIDAIKAMSELAGKLTTLTMLDVQPSRMRERTEPERIEP